MKLFTCTIETPLGVMSAAAGEKDGGKDALTGLWFAGQKYFPHNAGGHEKPDHPVFHALRGWLKRYFSGKDPGETPFPLAPRGTDFQRQVWSLLLEIPYGGLSSYGAVADRLAKDRGLASMSAQAVGSAVGHNPISILIPCHRVVGKDGGLTGYAGGLDKKRALLDLEARAAGKVR
jgi:methylated-DNA-[protein]-cysteine S-methyltransferase